MNNISKQICGNTVHAFLILILVAGSAAAQSPPESVRQDVTRKW